MLQDPDLLSVQEVRSKVEKASAAARQFRAFTQEQVDHIVEEMAASARGAARKLAEFAVEETGYGNAADKFSKNMLAADLLPRAMRGMKTIGVLRELPEQKMVEMAEPVGVVAAILPTTNPTSTAIYKALISVKAGNAVVMSPHPRARKCSCATAELLREAATRAGAPEDLVGCVGHATIEGTNALMKHPKTGVILSTGGSGIVRAAYSSGKPAYGVGPGNVPVLVDVSADIAEAVRGVVRGKSFDYGTLCSSEQTLVAERPLRDRILAELKACKAYLCDASQGDALGRLLITPSLGVNPECVGQPAARIAKMAGFEVPGDTSILAAEIQGIGRQYPLSAEKLSPVLSLYFVDGFEEAMNACEAVLRLNGLGHTCGIYGTDEARIREYAMRMPAFRVVANTPTPLGSTGITTNVFPAMTLGCGAMAGNSTGDNISPLHLINVKRLAWGVRASEGVDVDRNMVSEAVERFLARRVGKVEDERPIANRPQIANLPHTVDFVCEEDVRVAIAKGEKIYINERTIVTPSARDLAGRHDTLVIAS
ncbi:MAG: aldehyde dehydrogenase family protein [Acidobacteriota bacterium]|nr:aldehyde dehydrogenase family protein [Acidobacteriota bacterium]